MAGGLWRGIAKHAQTFYFVLGLKLYVVYVGWVTGCGVVLQNTRLKVSFCTVTQTLCGFCGVGGGGCIPKHMLKFFI